MLITKRNINMDNSLIYLINSAKESLVDLGLRNKLINLPKTGQGRSILFMGEITLLLEHLRNKIIIEIGGPYLRTDPNDKRPFKEIRTALLSLSTDASEIESEQGLNTLRMTLGSTFWNDPNGGRREAPLLTVPIRIARTPPGKNLIFQADGPIEVNESLVNLVKSNGEVININADNPLKSEIKKNSKLQLSLTDRITINLFTGSKLAMKNAIDIEKRPDIGTSGALRQLANDKTSFKVKDIHEGYLNYHLTDCDNSQNIAISTVLSISPSIIQGPPGTGKSQTIINVAANIINNNKSILICSQKVAALEVILRRIQAIGQKKYIPTLLTEKSDYLDASTQFVLATPQVLAAKIPLQQQTSRFDYLLIDEASQMQLTHAVIPASMANKICIIGDPHQMGPTNSFSRVNSTSQPTEQELSLLEYGIKQKWHTTMLTQHYRSRTPELIEYSNQHFYHGKLITSPTKWKQSNLGKFIHLCDKAIYYRDLRVNPIEAQALVSAAMNIAKNQKNSKIENRFSVGIITMNEPQRDLIKDMLGNELLRNGLNSSALSSESEKIFIKNIENIQGDERDHILISTTYGTDKNNKFIRNFGPLTGHNSANKLNVLITRSRRRNDIFISFPIDELPDDNSGAGHFKRYLNGIKKEIPTNDLSHHEIHSIMNLNGFTTETHGQTIIIGHPLRKDKWLFAINVYLDNNLLDAKANEKRLKSLGWKMHSIERKKLDNNLEGYCQNVISKLRENLIIS